MGILIINCHVTAHCENENFDNYPHDVFCDSSAHFFPQILMKMSIRESEMPEVYATNYRSSLFRAGVGVRQQHQNSLGTC